MHISYTTEPPPPLQVTISPSGDPLQRTEGSDVTLHCEVGGGGSVDTLRWLHNGVEVTEQLTRESNGLALSLEHLTVCLPPFFVGVYVSMVRYTGGGWRGVQL